MKMALKQTLVRCHTASCATANPQLDRTANITFDVNLRCVF